ncbi:MAG: GTPase HflX [Eubacteriales bacterium]|nr:GTPase HflX [Eubacteriales bacterium]
MMLQFDADNRVISTEEYRAILVGVQFSEDISYSMEELAGLSAAAGIHVLGQMVQNLDKSHPRTYVGKGKLEELAELCRTMEADLVIVNDELTGIQLRNMEEVLSVSVIDRTLLILDIFAARATSKEGKLQVEMAQQQYRMPRLTGLGKSLSRLGGGIGTRGPGEKKLETDRRHIQKRIDEIRREMEEYRGHRKTQRARSERSDLPIVALVGYTNSGKSSIMNRMLVMEDRQDKQVLEKDMLFATLDASRRLITMEDRHRFLLIDTVGFVSKLPHTLVKAFRSTLEEVVEADLLLHVVDASFPEADFHIDVTNKVLRELGAGDKTKLLLFNKIDLMSEPSLPAYGKNALAISTKTGQGYDELLTRIKELLFGDSTEVDVLIPYSRGDLVSYLCTQAQPRVLTHREDGTFLTVALDLADRKRFEEFILS